MSLLRKRTSFLVRCALTAALYAALSILFAPISYGPVQIRISEALCVLPYFTSAAIPGLFIGCVIANFYAGLVWADVLFGSLATLAAAAMSYLLRNYRFLVPFPAFLINTAAVPLILRFGYMADEAIPFMMLTVGAGELVSCYILGLPLLFALEKAKCFPKNGR